MAASTTPNEFSGFSPEAIDLLRRMGTADKAWFDANRAAYDELVVAPTRAFVTALGDVLASTFAPAVAAVPKANGSIAPINNDRRFAPDKSPYKDHLLLRFWEGPDKKTAPTLFVRLAPDGVGFATGAALGDLDRWRRLIDDDTTGRALADALADLAPDRDLDVDGQGYKRVPSPYPADHPRADLLRHKSLQARWIRPLPASLHSADFVPYCGDELAAAADVHRWLVANL